MSRFHVGPDVSVGWTGNREGDARLLCSVGTLVAGPFPKSHLSEGREMSGPWWDVEIDGHECSAAESILAPFDDPSESESRERARFTHQPETT